MTAQPGISSAAEASAAIARVPRSSTDELCLSIVRILSELDVSTLASRTLLEIAEILRPPADEVIAAYRDGYTDRPLPLGEEEARRFAYAMTLLVAFETLYLRALERAAAAPPDAAARNDMAVALQRCMAVTVAQMIEHYRARQSVGLGLWKRLQHGMRDAVLEKLDAVAAPGPLNPRGPDTPHAAYGRALLLSIAQAGAMTYRSLEATLALTAYFAHLVEVAMLDDKEGGGRGPRGELPGVGIRRTGRIRVVVVGGVTHLVNTTKIDGALNSCIQQLSAGGSPEQIGLATVARADLAHLLPRLRRIWCGGGEIRETERQPLQAQSAVAVGFREIFEFASPTPLTLPREFDVYAGQTPGLVRRTGQTLPAYPQANPVENWLTLDRSASGLRAKRPQPGARLRRGQLLGVGLSGLQEGSGFALAEVRWLQQFTEDEAGGIAAGIRFVSSNAQAALVRVIGLEPGQYQTVGPAFVLNDASGPDRLVLPPGWFAPGRRADLWCRKRLSAVQLTNVRARGADYEIVGYEPAPPPGPPGNSGVRRRSA